MRKMTVLIALVVLLSTVSFAANCGGGIPCQCGDTVTEGGIIDLPGGLNCGPGVTGLTVGYTGNQPVTIDCHNSLIQGSDGIAGIDLQYTNNVEIRHCEITGFQNGVRASMPYITTLIDNEFYGNTQNGLLIEWGATNFTVQQLDLWNNGKDLNLGPSSMNTDIYFTDLTFRPDSGAMAGATTMDWDMIWGFDAGIIMDHSTVTAPTNYALFGDRVVSFEAAYSIVPFDSMVWKWDASEDDAGVELQRLDLDTNNWELVSDTPDTANNQIVLTNHNVPTYGRYAYALLKPGTPVDVVPPIVDIITPSSAIIYHLPDVTLNYTATDDVGVDSCSYVLDGGPETTLNCNSAEVLTLTSDTHTITVYAYDAAGNVGSDTVTFTVQDVAAPYVDITSPYENQTFINPSSIDLAYSVTEAFALAGCTYSIDGGPELNDAACDGTTITSSLADGSHSITVRATDVNGFTGNDTVNFDVRVGGGNKIGCVDIDLPGDYTWNNPTTSAGLVFSSINPVNEVGFSKACIVIRANDVSLTCNEAPSSSLLNDIYAGGYPTGVFIYAPSVQNLQLNDCDIEGRVGGVVAVARGGPGEPLPGNIVIDGSDADYLGAMSNSPGAYTFVDVQGLTITNSDVRGGATPRMGFDLVRVVGADLSGLSVSGVNNPTSILIADVQPELGETDYGALRVYGSSDVQVSNSEFYGNFKDLMYRTNDLDMSLVLFKQAAATSNADSLLSFSTTTSENFALDGSRISSDDVDNALIPVGEKAVLIEKTNPANASILLDTVTYHWTVSDELPPDSSLFDQYRLDSSFNDEKLEATVDTQARTATLVNHDIVKEKEYLGLFGEITECTDIKFSGEYHIRRTLPGTQPGKDYCLGVTADDVTVVSEIYNWLLGDGSGIGLLASEVSGTTVVGKDGSIANYGAGAVLQGTTGASVDPIYLCDNNVGLLVNGSTDTLISDVEACNNTLYGLHILDSDNVTIELSKAYNNGEDLMVENTGALPMYLNIESLTLDRPAGDSTDFTLVKLSDSVEAGSSYSMSWTANTNPLGAGVSSFLNKFVEMSTIAGTPSVDSASLTWTDSELTSFDESQFELWKDDGSGWMPMSYVLDTAANTLTMSNEAPGAEYGIVSVSCTDADGDGYSAEGGDCGPVDCDDTNSAVNPGATEICNGVDDDCDSAVDEGGNAYCDNGLFCDGAEYCAGTLGCMAATSCN